MTTKDGQHASGECAATDEDSFFKEEDTTDRKVVMQWFKMNREGLYAFANRRKESFRKKLSRGVPNKFRWDAWNVWVHLEHNSQSSARHESFLEDRMSQHAPLIRIDICRTFPDLSSFDRNAQEQLFKILNLYAINQPDIGYCQGMNFLAGFVLLMSNFKLHQAYQMFTILMNNYMLHGLFRDRFPLLRQLVYAFDELAREHVPKLRIHFQREGVIPPMFLHQWLLTLFVTSLPLQTVAVLWDYFISSDLRVLLSLALTLLKVLEPFLLKMPFERAVKFLKTLRDRSDQDETRIGRLLVQQAKTLSIPPHLLQTLLATAASPQSYDTSFRHNSFHTTRGGTSPPHNFFSSPFPFHMTAYPFVNYLPSWGISAKMLLGAQSEVDTGCTTSEDDEASPKAKVSDEAAPQPSHANQVKHASQTSTKSESATEWRSDPGPQYSAPMPHSGQQGLEHRTLNRRNWNTPSRCTYQSSMYTVGSYQSAIGYSRDQIPVPLPPSPFPDRPLIPGEPQIAYSDNSCGCSSDPLIPNSSNRVLSSPSVKASPSFRVVVPSSQPRIKVRSRLRMSDPSIPLDRGGGSPGDLH